VSFALSTPSAANRTTLSLIRERDPVDKLPLDKKFGVLCQIVRAQHFAWHQAVTELCPDQSPADVTMRMWEITGEGTADAYLRRIDPARPLAPQVAAGIVWSSLSMGEDAIAEGDPGTNEAFVRHSGCPWYDWHEQKGLLAEDRPGCDAWFRSTIEAINRELGTRLAFETLESLPEGGSCCLRRLWEEDGPADTP